MSKYYIIPEYIRSECYEFNKGLFKFICNQDVSTNDFKQYFDQYPERSNIMHMIYYISQYIFYDSEGIFISVSIDSSFNIGNNAYHYPSLYTIRTDDSYIIRSFSITDYNSGGYNISNRGRDLKIIICYI